MTFTAVQQEHIAKLVQERLARADALHQQQLEAQRAQYASKIAKQPPATTSEPNELQARLDFTEAIQDLAVEVGPVPRDIRDRLRKLASVDKPSDLMAWLRTEAKALGVGGQKTQPATPAPTAPAAPPVVPAAAGSAPSASVDLSQPLTLAQLAQPGVAQEIIAREGAAGLNKRMQAMRVGQSASFWRK